MNAYGEGVSRFGFEDLEVYRPGPNDGPPTTGS